MTINKEYKDVVDVVHTTRNDHDEGIYICMCFWFIKNIIYLDVFVLLDIVWGYAHTLDPQHNATFGEPS